jgi:flagellar basal-body rod protein FlgB
VSLFTDPVQGAIERALDGVSLRQRIAAQNVSNAMTPGYQAQQVGDFESTLADALNGGSDPTQVSFSITGTGAANNENGNNVELETEQTGLLKDGVQYDALIAAANYRLNVLRTAVSG